MSDFDSTMMALGQLNQSLINATNVAVAAGTHKDDRVFSREMYARQLKDNRENWRMMNEYNAPSAQRERLRLAGLNENLVYGSGGLVGTTSLPNGSNYNGGYSQAPKLDQLSTFSDYMQLRQFERQEKLMEAQIDKMDAEKALIYANSANVEAQTQNQQFLNSLNLETRDWTVEQRELAVKILRNQYNIVKSDNTIKYNQMLFSDWWWNNGLAKVEALLKLKGIKVGINEAAARIKQLGALAINLRSQTKLNNKLYEIYDSGFSPNDGKFWHAIGDFVKYQTGGKSIGEAASDWIDKIFSTDWLFELLGDTGYYNGY